MEYPIEWFEGLRSIVVRKELKNEVWSSMMSALRVEVTRVDYPTSTWGNGELQRGLDHAVSHTRTHENGACSTSWRGVKHAGFLTRVRSRWWITRGRRRGTLHPHVRTEGATTSWRGEASAGCSQQILPESRLIFSQILMFLKGFLDFLMETIRFTKDI